MHSPSLVLSLDNGKPNCLRDIYNLFYALEAPVPTPSAMYNSYMYCHPTHAMGNHPSLPGSEGVSFVASTPARHGRQGNISKPHIFHFNALFLHRSTDPRAETASDEKRCSNTASSCTASTEGNVKIPYVSKVSDVEHLADGFEDESDADVLVFLVHEPPRVAAANGTCPQCVSLLPLS
ncbi:uncharacterized protein BCR38DRAFT_410716 [Pseudomassariella vexata]|uniref:Uncharacterized protein n=1 Tax=Pseudomassariella vexata TaxID=1141098 RepID=A0A1Y2DSN7_9PEZI|nr:uncharacterized protein BCR38DRAFT_410716 [Pseudomassariella vexata]ORY62282.1 hypothetical protein BCR38DRAFT_410716 [Pseudomassariella vexata]